jgi:hypothetical protein
VKRTYHIYAIRLDDAVLGRRSFLEHNPGYRPGKPCYYIGSSIYAPAVRFEKHKSGVKASRWVRDFGLWVSAGKCLEVRLAGADQPARAEREYAERLRAKGYGIWQN